MTATTIAENLPCNLSSNSDPKNDAQNALAAWPYRLDMVHHNPGEAPFPTKFMQPEVLRKMGYNGQVLKHFNALIRYEKSHPGLFPAQGEEARWLKKFTAEREAEMEAAKAVGLLLFGHIDLVILPRSIARAHGDALLSPDSGRISFSREATQELQREMFDEMFTRFPQIDGVVVRVGETYLFDTPFHVGGSACIYQSGEPTPKEKNNFVELLTFLREEVCEKHGKLVIYRTWDTWKDRFHSNADYYLDVTDQVKPHPKLLFAIKHSQGDFHRWMPFNPCLGIGRHPQIVEAQCQREYEGKGAFPCYIARCVIEGFPEQAKPMGLRDLRHNPLIQGVWTWTRGGGWYGPYLKSEFWPEINAAVLSAFSLNPASTEKEIFFGVVRDRFGVSDCDAKILHKIALLSETAVLKGKCCAEWDKRKHPRDNPCHSWFRDDRLGGKGHLDIVFAKLSQLDLIEEALHEKKEAVAEWMQIRELAKNLSSQMESTLRESIIASAEYGLRLFQWIEAAWRVIAIRWQPFLTPAEISKRLSLYDVTVLRYRNLPKDEPMAASLFEEVYWSWPNEAPHPGLGALVHEVRQEYEKIEHRSSVSSETHT